MKSHCAQLFTYVELLDIARNRSTDKQRNTDSLSRPVLSISVSHSLSCARAQLQHVLAQLVSCVSTVRQGILDLVTRLTRTHDLWRSCWFLRERDSGRLRQDEASASDSGPADVTVTENRGGHVRVSGEPDTSPLQPPPPLYYHSVSSPFLSVSHSFFLFSPHTFCAVLCGTCVSIVSYACRAGQMLYEESLCTCLNV